MLQNIRACMRTLVYSTQVAPPVLHYKISVGCVLLLSDLNIWATHWTKLMIFFIGTRRSRYSILFSVKL